MASQNDSAPYAISIIVPCLNEEKVIAQTLARLLETPSDVEIIVVDGGSTDGTLPLLSHPRVKVLQTTRGRGHQLDFGARAAQGSVLWFLHADTLITPGAEEALRSAMLDPSILSGNFSLVFGGCRHCAKFMTWLYRHLRLIGLCYGDSGFFCPCRYLPAGRRLQGFPDLRGPRSFAASLPRRKICPASRQDHDLVPPLRGRKKLRLDLCALGPFCRRFSGSASIRAAWAGFIAR